jgi:aspartate carbamoyltransferase catalytic subunit
MYKGSLVTIEDLSNGQIEDILDLAQEVQENLDAFHGLTSRRIMASLFLEPSTRTRGSFEAAMKRLGGETITTADAKSSSMEKGESLADTIRIWSGYSDLIVLRHPWEGAARLAAEYSDVPVINAGDGSHEHPTQTLLDLYTMRKELGRINGLEIVLCGDLKHGRTVHSLIYALLRFGAVIRFAPGEGLEPPAHVLHKITAEYNAQVETAPHPGLKALYGDGEDDAGALADAIYMIPSRQLNAAGPDIFNTSTPARNGHRSFAFYITRRQTERESGGGASAKYPKMGARVLESPDFSRAIILHPLPRVDELPPAMDSDPRSKYFEQAHNGVPVRMALIALMLGLRPWKNGVEEGKPLPTAATGTRVSGLGGVRCINQECVTQREPQSVKAEFIFHDSPCHTSPSHSPPVRFVCLYCEQETSPAFYASPGERRYYPSDAFPTGPVDPSEYTFFSDEAAAQAGGFISAERGAKQPSAGGKSTRQ